MALTRRPSEGEPRNPRSAGHAGGQFRFLPQYSGQVVWRQLCAFNVGEKGIQSLGRGEDQFLEPDFAMSRTSERLSLRA